MKQIAVMTGHNRLDAINFMQLLADKLKNRGVKGVRMNYRFLSITTQFADIQIFPYDAEHKLPKADKRFGFQCKTKPVYFKDYSDEIVDLVLVFESESREKLRKARV